MMGQVQGKGRGECEHNRALEKGVDFIAMMSMKLVRKGMMSKKDVQGVLFV